MLAAASAPAPAAAPRAATSVPVGAGEEATPLRGPAAALAGYMDESLSIPTATSFRTISVAVLDAQRREINDQLKAAGRSEKLSFTHLIAWAVVRAVAAQPSMTTGYALVDGAPHKLVRDGVSMGLAVDVERKDGSRSLLVPVVRDAGAAGFRGFRDAYDDLVSRTRAGKVKPDELRGASISLTNPGGLGTVASVPRLMPGQGTIIATGAIGYPAGFASAGPEALRALGVEKVMTMTSTYDHRVIQGAESGAFLAEIDRLLRGEDGFYDEVRDSLGLPAAAPRPETAEAAPAPAALVPAAPPAPAVAGTVDADLLEGVAAAMSVVSAYRSHGHLAARLDPLGAPPPGDPALAPERLELTPELMARIPASLLRVKVPGESFAAALPHLREAYCGTIAYEIEHLSDHQKRLWLRGAVESGRMRAPLAAERRLAILERLVEVDAFERFLRRTYLGQKTFSIEGVDALVPITDQVIELMAAEGTAEVVLGMAHRGRLAFITKVVGRPTESILAEFEGHMAFESGEEDMRETAGDVKYHLGAEGTYITRSGRPVTVKLAANPSHLEQVNAVAEGHTRARQTFRTGRVARHDPSAAVPVLIHGDAAFTGQGAVAETLNLAALGGYSTGGTVHIIANNQVGFTTDPNDSRSTYHVSDLARGYDIPVIHVNADDIDACITAAQIAVAYRQRYLRDVLINLIGYRRLGHNELDEPAYTQPVMSRTIKAHPPVSKIYAQKLVGEGLLTQDEVDAMIAAAEGRMREAHEAVTSRGDLGTSADEQPRSGPKPRSVLSAVSADVLRSLNEQLLTVPEGFTIHPKLLPQLERRREAMGPEGGITWAHAEALAFASLLTEGVPVRLTGQDTVRGTFSQRHLQLHDMGEGETWTPHTGPGLHADGQPPAGVGVAGAAQQPAVGGRRGGLRVRLQHPGARGARAVGGAVRRLRQRRPDHDRPVHRVGAREVGRALAAHPAAAARLRGQRPRALLGPHRALPAARRRGQHPRGQLQHRGELLPPAAQAGAHRPAAAADHLHAQEPAAVEGGRVAPGGPVRGPLPRRHRGPPHRGQAGGDHPAHPVLGEDLPRDGRAARARGAPGAGDRPRRDALPLPRGPPGGAVRGPPEPRAGDLGAGGAAQHGRVGVHPAADRAPAAGGGRRSTTAAGRGARAPPRATLKHTRPSRSGLSPQPSAARLGRLCERGGGRRGKATRRGAGRRPGRRRGGAARGATRGARDPDRAGGARRDVPQLGVHPHEGAPGDGRPAAAGAARLGLRARGAGGLVRLPAHDGAQGRGRGQDAPGRGGRGQAQGRQRGARPGARGGGRRGGGRRAPPLRPPRRVRRHRALGAPGLRHGSPGGLDLQRHPGARVGARDHARGGRRGRRLRVREPVRRPRHRRSRWWRSCPACWPASTAGRRASSSACWRRRASSCTWGARCPRCRSTARTA